MRTEKPDSMGHDFSKRPAFQFGKRTGFDDANAVADLALVGLVVNVVFLRALDDLVELGMGNAGHVFDDEGLVHFIGNDHANAGFAEMDLTVRGLDWCVRRSLAHGIYRWDLGLGERLGSHCCEDLSGFTTNLADARRILQ